MFKQKLGRYARFGLPAALAAVIAAAVVIEVVPRSSAQAESEAAAASTKVTKAAGANSQTAKAAAAATAFLKTLSSSQRQAVEYSFESSAKKSGWSNLPVGMTGRNGVAVEDLSSTQVAALRKLLQASLSAQGYEQEEAIRTADTYLSENGGGEQYGSGKYYIALFGSPSTTAKWTMEFGGHHLAIHITFAGEKVSGTPYFVGVEPTGFVYASKSYSPMKQESGAMVALFSSLNSSQLAAATLSQTFDDVLVGPGKDEQFPASEGQLVSELSAEQQALVTKAIKAWVDDVNTAGAKKILAEYKKGYDKTRIAWSTSIDPSVQGSYFRIDGPRVWIELVSQGGIVIHEQVHYHSIWRDSQWDYGV